MARRVLERLGGVKGCSYKKATISICLVNLLAALYVICSMTLFSTNSSDFWLARVQAKRLEESVSVRRALEPLELVRLAKKLSKSSEGGRLDISSAVKRKMADEILKALGGLGSSSNLTEQQERVRLWHADKLKSLKLLLSNTKANKIREVKEAEILESTLILDWVKVFEDIGLWIPLHVYNYEAQDKPENETDFECHAEPHTDYDGAAVWWGLTHHKATAADCCQACIEQAKHAKIGQMKCNIWVYCPSEFGCFSPDIYEHQYQECWLKEAKMPRLNFKGKYPETYRDSHPTAPVDVPWISGVIAS
ncbi:hypothetical protein HPP92_015824 [Vanilla planifolia]|uniref:Apple domain-containing protein n=1 Tax=Vanilla planifolia TaxID=51239 RepID=A0A835URI2_VANPL|nr:hypothetical protein HPP92_015824 [Vanilla planifolia]